MSIMVESMVVGRRAGEHDRELTPTSVRQRELTGNGRYELLKPESLFLVATLSLLSPTGSPGWLCTRLD